MKKNLIGIGILFFLRRRRAKKYYKAVKIFGGTAFWNQKEENINDIHRYEVEIRKGFQNA